LFLAISIAATPTFDDPIEVPPDFTGTQLAVPHPAGGALYVKLRDDPGTVQTLTLPVLPANAAALSVVTPRTVEPPAEAPTEPPAQPKTDSPAPPQSQTQPGNLPASGKADATGLRRPAASAPARRGSEIATKPS
jgi:hypothetical protein